MLMGRFELSHGMPGRLENHITFTAILRIIDGSIQDYPAGRARADAVAMHEYCTCNNFLERVADI